MLIDWQAAVPRAPAVPVAPLGLSARVPKAPAWFTAALAIKPEQHMCAVNGAPIEWLEWGQRDAAPLLLVHGNGASAAWWRFVAPLLAEDHHVVALSLSGSGRSGWRETYGSRIFAREVLEVSEAAGMIGSGRRPIIIGQSLGGAVAVAFLGLNPRHARGLILVDTLIHAAAKWGLGRDIRALRTSPTRTGMFARFRFAPPQPCANKFIAHFLAAEGMVHDAGGWTWRHDPRLLGLMDFSEVWSALPSVGCPLLVLRGEHSVLAEGPMFEAMLGQLPSQARVVTIPGAYHHILADQPLALIAAVRTQIKCWPEDNQISLQAGKDQ